MMNNAKRELLDNGDDLEMNNIMMMEEDDDDDDVNNGTNRNPENGNNIVVVNSDGQIPEGQQFLGDDGAEFEHLLDLGEPERSLKRYFAYGRGDVKALCRLCEKTISRKDQSTSGMVTHLRAIHGAHFLAFQRAKAEFAESNPEAAQRGATTNRLGYRLSKKGRKMGRAQKSSLWRHFDDLGEGKVRCGVCQTELSRVQGSTKAMWSHMRRMHPELYSELRALEGLHDETAINGNGNNSGSLNATGDNSVLWADASGVNGEEWLNSLNNGGDHEDQDDDFSLDSRLKMAKIAYYEAQAELAATQMQESRVRTQLLELEYQQKLQQQDAHPQQQQPSASSMNYPRQQHN